LGLRGSDEPSYCPFVLAFVGAAKFSQEVACGSVIHLRFVPAHSDPLPAGDALRENHRIWSSTQAQSVCHSRVVELEEETTFVNLTSGTEGITLPGYSTFVADPFVDRARRQSAKDLPGTKSNSIQ
jgi:hypothetical protein